MAIISSSFTDSHLAVSHNAVKSILFRCAELLLAYTIWKLFSLMAAKGKRFTSYLMFGEDLFQKGIYIFSHKGLNGFLVLAFAIAYTLAQLFGTLLWGLDSPGYIERSKNVSAASLNNSLLPDPAYVVTLTMRPDEHSILDESLPQIIGSNLYKTGINFTLTGNVERGAIDVTAPTRRDIGPRIWLDDEGLSVSADNYVTVSWADDLDEESDPLNCPTQLTSEDSWGWNCTFNHTYTKPLMEYPIGRPEVHWDDASDLALNSRYVRPNRQNNIWSAFGQGGGSVGMKQMFTVTKGKRRHTFIENVIKFTMVTDKGIPFSPDEVSDFVKRTWSSDPEEQKAPLVGWLTESILSAQENNKSYMYGLSSLINASVVQPHWEFLTMLNVNKAPILSMLRISAVNITLIRSETIEEAPVPFESCTASFQNEAEGGRVTDTDCAGSNASLPNPRFFGEVDTSAVLILYGLGDGRSNISSAALNQENFVWLQNNSNRMDELLISRGFTVSIDPALVTVKTTYLTPAISYLQLFLVLVTIVLAPIGWFCLQHFAGPYWANSLLSNLLSTTGSTGGPGYIRRAPDIQLWDTPSRKAITVDKAILKLEDPQGSTSDYFINAQMATPGYGSKSNNVAAEEIRVSPNHW